MSYQYSLLRFVPDPARGEFVNLGAVVGDGETGDWEVRTISGLRRAKALDDRGRLGIGMDFIGEIDAQTVEPERSGLSVESLVRMSEEMNNVVQLTSPAPVVAASAAEALDLLFHELVVDPAGPRKVVKKWQAVRATLDAYRNHDIPSERLSRYAEVVSPPYTLPFDFAVHNGTTVQLVQCWSFQVLGQEELAKDIRSWAWAVQALQREGGSVISDSEPEPIEVGADVEVGAVYVSPLNGSHAFEEAQAAFQDINVHAVDEGSVNDIAASAALRLGVTAA